MRFNTSIACIFALFILVAACQNKKQADKYPGFTETSSGLFYHRLTIGEGKNYPLENDFLLLHLRFKTMGDEVIPLDIFKNENGFDTLHFKAAKKNNQLYEALSLLSEGDSCLFIAKSALLFDTCEFRGILSPFKNDTLLKIEAILKSIKTPEMELAEKAAYQKLCAELWADEMVTLKHYLDTTKQNYPKTPDENGIYYFTVKNGKGKKAKNGDALTIRYCGKFLDGKIFDTSTYEKEALSFRLGEPGQVIKGIELALYKMQEGEIATILLPSSLAFGIKGSAGGIVSPFKTVTFALEILKIN